MYRTLTQAGARGRPSGEGGHGPPPRDPGQPYPGGGGYGGPPGGLPGGGGGAGGAGPIPMPQIGPHALTANGGLKGTTPTIFDGNRKHTKQFTQEFTLYRMINQDSPTMCNAYTRTTLALSFMRGPAINDWVLQQTEKLYLKCNGDTDKGIGPTY